MWEMQIWSFILFLGYFLRSKICTFNSTSLLSSPYSKGNWNSVYAFSEHYCSTTLLYRPSTSLLIGYDNFHGIWLSSTFNCIKFQQPLLSLRSYYLALEYLCGVVHTNVMVEPNFLTTQQLSHRSKSVQISHESHCFVSISPANNLIRDLFT